MEGRDDKRKERQERTKGNEKYEGRNKYTNKTKGKARKGKWRG